MSSFGMCPPVNVPMVRVVDEKGKEVVRGWYYRHVTRQPGAAEVFIGSSFNDSSEIEEIIYCADAGSMCGEYSQTVLILDKPFLVKGDE